MLRHLAEAERTRSPAPVPRSWLWLGSSVLLQGGRGQLSVLPSSRIAGTEILLGLVTDAFGDFVRNNLRGHHRMQWIQGRMRGKCTLCSSSLYEFCYSGGGV